MRQNKKKMPICRGTKTDSRNNTISDICENWRLLHFYSNIKEGNGKMPQNYRPINPTLAISTLSKDPNEEETSKASRNMTANTVLEGKHLPHTLS